MIYKQGDRVVVIKTFPDWAGSIEVGSIRTVYIGSVEKRPYVRERGERVGGSSYYIDQTLADYVRKITGPYLSNQGTEINV